MCHALRLERIVGHDQHRRARVRIVRANRALEQSDVRRIEIGGEFIEEDVRLLERLARNASRIGQTVAE